MLISKKNHFGSGRRKCGYSGRTPTQKTNLRRGSGENQGDLSRHRGRGSHSRIPCKWLPRQHRPGMVVWTRSDRGCPSTQHGRKNSESPDCDEKSNNPKDIAPDAEPSGTRSKPKKQLKSQSVGAFALSRTFLFKNYF